MSAMSRRAHVHVVDVIGRIAVALEHALDRNLRVLRPLASCFAEAVVEDELDAGAVHGFSLSRTVEQHVLHRLAAQVLRGSFAEHPAHASMMFDLPQPLGPTMPTSWPGVGMRVGSTKDLKPAS
jgi:hypothetical protein